MIPGITVWIAKKLYTGGPFETWFHPGFSLRQISLQNRFPPTKCHEKNLTFNEINSLFQSIGIRVTIIQY